MSPRTTLTFGDHLAGAPVPHPNEPVRAGGGEATPVRAPGPVAEVAVTGVDERAGAAGGEIEELDDTPESAVTYATASPVGEGAVVLGPDS